MVGNVVCHAQNRCPNESSELGKFVPIKLEAKTLSMCANSNHFCKLFGRLHVTQTLTTAPKRVSLRELASTDAGPLHPKQQRKAAHIARVSIAEACQRSEEGQDRRPARPSTRGGGVMFGPAS